MDLRKLKTLIELVESSGIAELEIQEGEERVRITRATAVASPRGGGPGRNTARRSRPGGGAPNRGTPRASGEKPDGRHVLSIRDPRIGAIR